MSAVSRACFQSPELEKSRRQDAPPGGLDRHPAGLERVGGFGRQQGPSRGSEGGTRLLQVFVVLFLTALAVVSGQQVAAAQTRSPRIALVVGNGNYAARPVATAPNDAGLVAQTLTAAGFDVIGARDLDGDALHRTVRDFIDHAAHLGPDGIALVYLAGLGVQYGGENYYVPVDASLARETDVPLQAFRLSDLTRALASLPIQARVVVLDGAYRNDFPARQKLAGGLALVEPEAGTLLALNAAPDTVGPDTTGSYGVYAQAVADMMREPGVPVAAVFDRIRLKVNQDTQGADVPWSQSKLTAAFTFLEPVAGAPAPQATAIPAADLQKRPLRDFTPADAYNAAIARDDFEEYREYLETFPKSPYARRVRVLLAARREALTWRRTVAYATPNAYWSYLGRYPRGLHAFEARDRLASLAAPPLPPADFAPVEYDVPPPPEPEIVIVDRPVIVFEEPDDAPPPPPPLFLLPASVEVIDDLPPPEPAIGPAFLPVPIPIPIPFGRPRFGPGEIRPPRGVPGGYAQPQPFVGNPEGGGLQPRPRPNGQTGQVPNVAGPVPAPAQPVPGAGAPVAGRGPEGVPALAVPSPGRPGPSATTPATGVSVVRPAAPPAVVLPGQGGPGTRPVFDASHRLPLPIGANSPRPAPSAPPATNVARPAPVAPAAAGGAPPTRLPAPNPGPQKATPVAPATGAAQRMDTKAAPAIQTPPAALPAKAPAAPPIANKPLDLRKQPQDQGRQQQIPQPDQAHRIELQQQRQQQDQLRQKLLQQQRQQQDQARQQQLLLQRQQQDQARQQQIQQQRAQQDQARQQQLQQQRQQQEQARQQQLQQQRQQQDQARQQQIQQQRAQQDQVRQQQLQQQRQQQDQVRQQQLQQQRQQQEQAHQQQMQQQRQQQLQNQRPPPRQDCGKPGQPACH